MNWFRKAKKFSGINILNETKKSKFIRNNILKLSEEYFNLVHHDRKYIPGETFISASGKSLNNNDLKNLIDSSLDLWLTSGRYNFEFEQKLAKKFGSSFASSTVSGSSANLLAFTALTSDYFGKKKIKDGDEIITVAAGFPTTVAPIIHNRCVPVYLDVDLKTANIDTSKLNEALTKKTKAIILGHTLGNPFKVDVIKKFCEKNNLFLIEDCCDAFGSAYDGKPVGSSGIFSTLSFYPAHHITTGEGGAVLYNNIKLRKIINSFRDWGRDCWCETGMNNTCGKRFSWSLGKLPKGYDHKFIFSNVGYNLKMTDMQAALGTSQLDRIEKFISKRKKNFEYMKKKFLEEGLDKYFILPSCYKKSEPSWYGFLIIIRNNINLNRNEITKYLSIKRIHTRLLFAGNLTKQPGFINKKHKVIGSLKNTDKFMKDSFWIGVWPGLNEEHLNYMVTTISKFVRSKVR